MNRPTSRSNDLERIVAFVARSIVAGLIMMWGVINLVHNFLSWRADGGWSESNSWIVSLGFIIVTGIVPLLIGIWILAQGKPKNE